MSSPEPRGARRGVPAPRHSLSGTVLRLAAIALVAAVLVWSVLVVNVLRERSAVGATPAQPTGQQGDQAAQAPAPVTTRSS